MVRKGVDGSSPSEGLYRFAGRTQLTARLGFRLDAGATYVYGAAASLRRDRPSSKRTARGHGRFSGSRARLTRSRGRRAGGRLRGGAGRCWGAQESRAGSATRRRPGPVMRRNRGTSRPACRPPAEGTAVMAPLKREAPGGSPAFRDHAEVESSLRSVPPSESKTDEPDDTDRRGLRFSLRRIAGLSPPLTGPASVSVRVFVR
jgi:hypothetical protein